MTPELCRGSVMHARFGAAANRFVYPLFFVALPLSQLERAGNRWFSIDRPGLLSLRYADHGARDGSAPLPWIRALLAREGIDRADGEVVLQAFPRVLGRVFNPVSFWFCHDREGDLRAVLAEVNNTFGERHNYLVVHPDQRPIAPEDRMFARKVFHVSPFFPVDGEYRFRFDLSNGRRRVEIDYWRDGKRVLATAVGGRGVPLDASTALRAGLAFPALALGVLARIHWQALRLWLKGATFFRKPTAPLQETTR
ncbi:DUF1365 domain-containing protein [Sulfurisoma sediminicola]|uniref:DUF1365 family protein n=1 Tax=Sulfurisoma sediminicola TaxID=1381557 RepID=A0A497XEE7_9PROT|nr:DUF1365 domain-containing protein [Sulfurisoma sediminicola]RLJ64905.1 hypothetical protein DFR35_1554 [Sulfurisoma sediminicola]